MTPIRLRDCEITSSSWRTRWLRRKRWNVTIHHVPTGIIGAGLGARSYSAASNNALDRIESLRVQRGNYA